MQIMKVVDENRAKYGLKPLGELRASGELKDILTQQKVETVDALSVVARPVEVRLCMIWVPFLFSGDRVLCVRVWLCDARGGEGDARGGG